MRAWVLLAMLTVGCGRAPTTASEPGSPPPGTPPSAEDPPAVVPAEPASDRKEPSPSETSKPSEPDTAKEPPSNEPPTPDPLAAVPSRSTSIGSPTAGRLDGALPLPLKAPGLLFLPSKDPGSRYGTVELVQGLVKAAATVERTDPGAPVTIGDLARERGGDISGHASHRSGRDVDVLFYLRHEDGRPFVPSKFIPLDPQGHGTDYKDLADPDDDVPVRLDVGRTWSFVAALLGDDAAAVQKILVAEHLRTLLLEEARRVKAEGTIVQRFADVTCQPRFPHDDHMHIRVFCSAEDIEGGCLDTRPIFPWRRKALKEQGASPVLAGRDPAPANDGNAKPKPKPKLKTIEQARAEAGPMHQDVVDFLDRRQAWARKPHPGRRWCR